MPHYPGKEGECFMTESTVLLVEDDALVRDTMAAGLEEEGYTITTAASVREFVEKIRSKKPDIILLDILLPDGNGLGLMKDIRAETDVPVIIISGKNDLSDRITGLDMGADDYISKPVQIREVSARVRAQLRRYQGRGSEEAGKERRSAAERLAFNRWIHNRPQMQVHDQSGQSANLTLQEFRLLDVLISSPNRVFSRQYLLDRLRADNYDITDRAIDVQIMRLRRKIGDRPGPAEIIRSIRGVGYMFVVEAETLR